MWAGGRVVAQVSVSRILRLRLVFNRWLLAGWSRSPDGDSTAKVPQLQSDIVQSVSTVARLKVELKQHQEDRAAANVAVAEATRLREKEHAEYASEAAELGGYVTALSKAIPALESGMSGAALLQSAAQAAQLRRAAYRDEQLTEDDRQSVLSFLEGRSLEADGNIPQGGEIVGVLKSMREDLARRGSGRTLAPIRHRGLLDDFISLTRAMQGLHLAAISRLGAMRIHKLPEVITTTGYSSSSRIRAQGVWLRVRAHVDESIAS